MRFIMVDEIWEMIPGKSVRATKYVAPNEDYFQDHFPGFPVVPGVLITEMMAQAAGKCLDAESPARGRSMLGKITTASFRDWVLPDTTVTLFGEIRTSRPQFATAVCRAEVQGKIIATSELFYTFVPPTRFPPGLKDEVLERFFARQLSPSPQSADR